MSSRQKEKIEAMPQKRESRCSSSPYWKTGPDALVVVPGMKPPAEIATWVPAIAHLDMRKLEQTSARKTVLKVLEICSGCCSVSSAAGNEARENFGVDEVEVFSVDGKRSTNATRIVDILQWDWQNDELLNQFRYEQEEDTRYIYYTHASPPCGMYSSMSCPTRGPLSRRDLAWGDSVAQRCMELIHWFEPHFWTMESRGPPGLDTRIFMRDMERLRSTVNYCRYGMQRWKRTSIWTNISSWVPEPKCICRPPQCCAHFMEYGTHLEKVQRLSTLSPTFAALPEQLVRAWTRAALADIGLVFDASALV